MYQEEQAEQAQAEAPEVQEAQGAIAIIPCSSSQATLAYRM